MPHFGPRVTDEAEYLIEAAKEAAGLNKFGGRVADPIVVEEVVKEAPAASKKAGK